MRLRSGDKHQLRKSADRKAQISPVSEINTFLICAFRSAELVFIPRAQTSRTISFSISNSFWCLIISNSFWYYFDSFFSMGRTVQPNTRWLVRFFDHFRANFERGRTKSEIFTKEAIFLAAENVNSMRISAPQW